MKNFALFKRHVLEIHGAAKIIIEKKQSKVHWPELLFTNAGEEGFCVGFSDPVVLWDAPLRGSAGASLKRRAILMDGTFYFKEGNFDKGGAKLEVYSTIRKNGDCLVELLEAMHFDIEPDVVQSPFHPMFHVQFGKNKNVDEAGLTARIAELARIEPHRVKLDREKISHTRDIRIPTPQMDYLSMLIMVIADYFCEKNSANEVKAGFRSLLKRVMDSKNSARDGRQSKQLEKRWTMENSSPFCASHWYQESCS